MTGYRWLAVGILLVAWAVRLHNINYHSLWFDEAISVHWAKQSVPRILEVGFTLDEDRLPPLYYLLLKGWTAWVGFSETGLRLLSVVVGVLLIPLVAQIARLLFNHPIGIIAAALVALNPFLIWYAQEVRMYTQAVTCGTLAILACLLALRSTGYHFVMWVGVFILSATAAMYSHLYAGFLLPALGLWLFVTAPRRVWLTFGGACAVVALLYASVAWRIWQFSGEAQPGAPLQDSGMHALWLLKAFTLWQADIGAWLPLTLLGIAGLAYVSLSRGKSLALVTLLLVAPFGIATLLLFRNYLAFFGERYFIVMVPWLLILLAVGSHNLGVWLNRLIPYPWVWLVPVLVTLGLAAYPIPGLWTPEAAKEAWRQSVVYLREYATPQDGILIHPDWVRYPFQYYFEGPGQTYAAFSTVSTDTALDGPLQGVVSDHPVIWLVQSHLDGPDPHRRVEAWFAARYPLVTEAYPPGVTVKAYAPGYQHSTLPTEATATSLTFNNGMHLVGYRADARVSAQETLFHPPSGWAHVTLYWQASRPITDTATVYVHLVGPEGIWGADLARPNDALSFYPPPQWTPNMVIIRHDVDVNLNPVTPPGTYELVVGLHQTGEQHPLTTITVD